MALDDWQKRPDGDIAVYPFLGWETAVGPLHGLLRLSYATTEEQYETGGEALQLAMTPVQMHELAQALLRMATMIETQPFGTKQ